MATAVQRATAREIGRSNKTHGLSGTPEYGSWVRMMNRCYNQKDRSYRNYGMRGICVCASWHSASKFAADMGKRPEAGFTLERKDNTGNYEPSNCKWATRKEQNGNQRRVKLYRLGKETHHLADWAKLFRVKYTTLRWRVVERGLPLDRALDQEARYGNRFACAG